MLLDVIRFIQSRAGITDRETALREINFAWRELWAVDDLPNSLFEISVQPADRTLARLTLPHYVGQIRAVKKTRDRLRIHLNTPRANYQAAEYIQSPFTWAILGSTPLKTTITNATTLDLSFAEEQTEQITATLIGPTDNAAEDREQIVFDIGDTTKSTTKRFSDLVSASKDKFTSADLNITAGDGTELGFIPNNEYTAANLIVQIHDKCQNCTPCDCDCFDVLYKRTAPILYYDESPIPGNCDEALMAKTLEWILLPKDGQDQKALLFAEKSKAMMSIHNEDRSVGKEQRLDLGPNYFTTPYHGHL